MWQKVIPLLLSCLNLSACATVAPHNGESVRESYQDKYPYTVLGGDFGLLTEEDVALSSCVARPAPFVLSETSAHPYWQCFSVQSARFECEEADPNEEGRSAILAIVLEKDGVAHEYLSRRAIPLDACESHRDDWIRLTADQSHVCVSGQFIEGPLRKKSHFWIFESYKTAKGCDSYFFGGCDLAYQIQHGCNLAEMSKPIVE